MSTYEIKNMAGLRLCQALASKDGTRQYLTYIHAKGDMLEATNYNLAVQVQEGIATPEELFFRPMKKIPLTSVTGHIDMESKLLHCEDARGRTTIIQMEVSDGTEHTFPDITRLMPQEELIGEPIGSVSLSMAYMKLILGSIRISDFQGMRMDFKGDSNTPVLCQFEGIKQTKVLFMPLRSDKVVIE